MKTNMNQWFAGLASDGRPMPILSFPSVSLMGISVREITRSAELQARGMKMVADRVRSAAAVSMMDLSVEAEAFGCTIKAEENEIPTVIGALLADEQDARALRIPELGAGRTGVYVEALREASKLIIDRPIFAGIIGPFSLAGRLMDVSEALVNCIAEPDFMRATLNKATEFLIKYAAAYKTTGASGLLMAEPLAGLLSPELEREFSAPYVRAITDAVKSDDFSVIYHNCGANTPHMTESLAQNGASAYHFGDAVDIEVMLQKMPSDLPILGNISPTAHFMNGTPESVYNETSKLLERCSKYPNFVLSSGCDIPPAAPWENIDAFFAAALDFKSRKGGT